MRLAPLAWLNRWFANNVMAASASQNEVGERIGGINRFFQVAYRARLKAKALKQSHRRVYYLLQWVLVFGLIYAIFLW